MGIVTSMNGHELIAYGLQASRFQLEQVFTGLEGADWDANPIPSQMTPRKIAEHLCEVYQATLDMAAGKTFEWGTYVFPAEHSAEVFTYAMGLRAQCEALVTPATDADGLKKMIDYVILHDAYHVGQMCAHRLAIDPAWNAYSIYPSH